jgi:hypothetical protein
MAPGAGRASRLRPAQGDGGDRDLPHRRARRHVFAVRPPSPRAAGFQPRPVDRRVMIKNCSTAASARRLGRRHSLVRHSLAGGNVRLEDHRHLTIGRGYRSAAHTETHAAAPCGTGDLPRSTARHPAHPPIAKSPKIAASPRGFLLVRLSDASPQPSRKASTGPASKTLQHSDHTRRASRVRRAGCSHRESQAGTCQSRHGGPHCGRMVTNNGPVDEQLSQP